MPILKFANTQARARLRAMSTVMEIETAIERLPINMQHQLAAWLESKLWPETPAILAAIDEAERSLAEEGGVPVEDVRNNLHQWIIA